MRRIVTNSVELVKFVFRLGLRLSRPQTQHVLNMADAILVSDERKTMANLNRQLVEAKDDSSKVHRFRASPWSANDLLSKLLVFLVRTAIGLACMLGLEKIICLSIDNSLCVKDAATTCYRPGPATSTAWKSWSKSLPGRFRLIKASLRPYARLGS